MSTDTQADERAIRKLIDDWMQATAQGDAARGLSMMSDDVVFMTAGSRAGYTLTILNRQADGRWLITRDANLMPPPG